MKIIDRLNEDRINISFEVFPPKTDAGFANVQRATDEIAKLDPSYISVTYGAGGGTSKEYSEDRIPYQGRSARTQSCTSDLCFFQQKKKCVR